VRHDSFPVFQLAEVAVPWALFATCAGSAACDHSHCRFRNERGAQNEPRSQRAASVFPDFLVEPCAEGARYAEFVRWPTIHKLFAPIRVLQHADRDQPGSVASALSAQA
jgi:hypothetical protein